MGGDRVRIRMGEMGDEGGGVEGRAVRDRRKRREEGPTGRWERWIDAEEAGGEGTRTVNLTQNLNK